MNQPAQQSAAHHGYEVKIHVRAGQKRPIPGVQYSSRERSVAVEICMQVSDYDVLSQQIKKLQDISDSRVLEKFAEAQGAPTAGFPATNAGPR